MIATTTVEKPKTAEEQPVDPDYFSQLVRVQGIAVDPAYMGLNVAGRIRQAVNTRVELSDSVEDDPKVRDVTGDRAINAVMHLYASATALKRNLGDILIERIEGRYVLGYR